jgi:hypothetical protein
MTCCHGKACLPHCYKRGLSTYENTTLQSNHVYIAKFVLNTQFIRWTTIKQRIDSNKKGKPEMALQIELSRATGHR